MTATAVVAVLLLAPRRRLTKLTRIRKGKVPASWDGLLRRRMPQYRHMGQALRERLTAQMQVFLHEKQFTGCNGLEVTEEMRVLVAGWAS